MPPDIFEFLTCLILLLYLWKKKRRFMIPDIERSKSKMVEVKKLKKKLEKNQKERENLEEELIELYRALKSP